MFDRRHSKQIEISLIDSHSDIHWSCLTGVTLVTTRDSRVTEIANKCIGDKQLSTNYWPSVQRHSVIELPVITNPQFDVITGQPMIN